MNTSAPALGRRRFFIPEVIQTSGMDCGPAALKALLDGFRMPVSYGRLREACHTDVDGTSIDTLEEIAQTLHLHAEQIMIPMPASASTASNGNRPGARGAGGASPVVGSVIGLALIGCASSRRCTCPSRRTTWR